MSGEALASKVESATLAEPTFDPLITERLPLLTRINFAIQMWCLKCIVWIALRMRRFLDAPKWRAITPTMTKRYPIRPTLESRVFFPKDYISGKKLPLYLDIHGGGFVLCDPAEDDQFCHFFANKFGYLVVSLDYRKAPSYPFPIPVYDCAELARAVLADDSLPIDHEKVVLGGFSAGANLSLAVAQIDDLKQKFKAVVPVYPPCDLSRTFRGDYITTPDGKEDTLKSASKLFNWAYVNPGTDRRNPLLSCIFATRKMLPQKMFFIGCEYDVLCHEASVMAKRLAGVPIEADLGPKWTKNGISWVLIPGQQHGFDQQQMKGEEEVKRLKATFDMYEQIGVWLKSEAFRD